MNDGDEINIHSTNPNSSDSDNDGLTDNDEINIHSTNPLDADSDSDGLTDGDEISTWDSGSNSDGTICLESCSYSNDGACDDGGESSDYSVCDFGTDCADCGTRMQLDPNNSDSDGDGLNDGDEINSYFTDPLNTDSDSDGLADNDEINTYSTNPILADSDSDNLNDGDEINTYLTDPLDADSDSDGLTDGDEISTWDSGSNSDGTICLESCSYSNDGACDDGGESSDYSVCDFGTDCADCGTRMQLDPNNSDSDGDGLNDGDETNLHLTNPLSSDSDSDQLPDNEEVNLYGTNPNSSDSDGDNFSDYDEVNTMNTDPSEYTETWTIFVYGHADHNLSNSLYMDMVEMSNAILGAHVKVIVRADWSSGREHLNTGTYYNSGTEYYSIEGNGASFSPYWTGTEQDSDDPDILATSIEYAFSSFPADHYGLVLWDHGGSWDGGFGLDEGDTPNNPFDDGDGLSINELQYAFSTAIDNLGWDTTVEPPIDFLSFDTCLMMGNEVAYAFKDFTKIYIASAELDYGVGWDYEATFSQIAANPNQSLNDFASAEVDFWDAHHASATVLDGKLRTQTAINTSHLETYASQWYDLGDYMYFSNTLNWEEIARVRYFSKPGYLISADINVATNLRDVGQFLHSIGSITSDSTVASQANSVLSTLNSMTINQSLGDLRIDNNQSGMHFELSTGNEWLNRKSSYQNLAWDVTTEWSYLLDSLSNNSDTIVPSVYLTGSNLTNPDANNLPTISIGSYDTDIAEGAVFLESADSGVNYGLIWEQPLQGNSMYTNTWGGQINYLHNSTQSSAMAIFPYISPYTSNGVSFAGLFSVAGNITNASTSEESLAQLIFSGDTWTVDMVLITEPNTGQVHSLTIETLEGWDFTPILLVNWMPVEQNSLTLSTSDPLQWGSYSALPGNYKFSVYLSDVYENTAIDELNFSIQTSF